MKTVKFDASCPFEIGDQIVDGDTGSKKTITDIVCMHYVRDGKIEFLFELDNSGRLVKILLGQRRTRK